MGTHTLLSAVGIYFQFKSWLGVLFFKPETQRIDPHNFEESKLVRKGVKEVKED